jgi:uncharacterized protein (DUF2267 family)
VHDENEVGHDLNIPYLAGWRKRAGNSPPMPLWALKLHQFTNRQLRVWGGSSAREAIHMAKKTKRTKRALSPKILKTVSWEMGELAAPETIPLFRVRGGSRGGTGIAAFDRTIQKTNIWIKELMQEMGWQNRERTYGVLRACLHSTRDILTNEEVTQFGAQLPTLLRGAYFDGWKSRTGPIRIKTVEEFYDLVFQHLGAAQKHFSDDEIRAFTHAYFNVATKHVSSGEMLDVKAGLPKKVQNLIPTVLEWPRRRQRAA